MLLPQLAVVAAAACLVFAWWPVAMVGARRRARRAGDALGQAEGEVPAARAGETVTLVGRIEVEGPCTSFEGEPAAAATVRRRLTRRYPAEEADVRARTLRLVVDETSVVLEGPVHVVVGSRETDPRRRLHRLPTEVQDRVERAAPSRSARESQSHVWFRHVRAGDRVRVRGRLERTPDGESQRHYRQRSGRWQLTAAPEVRALELVAAQPTPVSQPRSVWTRRALLTGALTLGVLPWTLGLVGDMLQRGSNQTLTRCDPAGFGSYRTADGLYALQAVFPGWRAAALKGRTQGVTSVVNGVRVCAISRAAPPALVNGLVLIARERLADTAGAQGFEHARRELEETLHEHGRDREIVALQEALPRGGDVEPRVRAHLYLGDLEGAANTWREPNAHGAPWTHDRASSKGNVLCMAGDFEAGLEALEAETRDDADTRFRIGECAVRAGRLDLAEEMARALVAMEGRNAAAWLRARVALARGHEARAVAESDANGGASALPLAMLGATVSRGHWRPLRAALRPFHGVVYDASMHPVVSIARLEAIAARAARQAEEDDDANLRELASTLYSALALRRSRRWDPAAAEAFEHALALTAEPERVNRLRAACAFHHGEWNVPPDVDLSRLRQLGRAFEGDETIQLQPTNAGNRLSLYALHPNELRDTEQALVELYRASMPDTQKLEMLREQKLTADLPAIFFRLGLLAVYGPRFGADASRYTAQMAALRAMVVGQPNPYLLTGLDGLSSF